TLLKDAKVRHKRTVLGVPGQSVFTRTRALPPVPEYKVTQIVRYEIQQQIPFSLDQIAFDYQVLQRTEAGGYDVLMAAIKVDVVEKRLDIIRDVKRQVDTVDVCPLAAYNWLKYTGEFGEEGDCVALIDLGAATTDIVIERDNQFRFTRSLNLGGNDVSSAIAAEFGVSFADAEKMKRERGFAPSGDPQRDGKGGEVIGRVLNRLVSEISRSFAYFRSQPGGGPVSRIIVTGGGACLRNMIPFLQRQLGIEVRVAQPLAGLAITPGAQEVNEHPEQAAVALGLALRCCERVAIGVNLIPPRILEAARRKEQVVYWALSLLTLGLIVLSIVPSMAQRNNMILEQIELEKTAISRYDPRIVNPNTPPQSWKSPHETELSDVKAEIARYKDIVTKLDGAYTAFKPWLDYLNTVNDSRPPGKLVLLWSAESTWLEGVAAPAPSSSSRPSSRSEGRRSRGRGGDDDEDDSAASTAGSSGVGVIQAPPLKYSSTGFRGIISNDAVNATVGRGRRDGDTQSEAQGPSENPGRYNGLTIQGYADSVETIQQYVENLRESNDFLEGKGVFWDDRFTDPVPPTVLDNGGQVTSSPSQMGGGGFRDSGGDGDEDRRGRGRGGAISIGQNIGGYGRPGGQSDASLWMNPSALYPFRIDLQFSGEPADEQAPTAGSGASAASRFQPGGGLRPLINREED
ncbi:MAG: type IV pilus assembly protein PilM, partial [Candidatus Hydrogenedentes bacterium]|nr:type IV pilus assembly protein PilM [Candidatus Hydrogenedentota bacterium]